MPIVKTIAALSAFVVLAQTPAAAQTHTTHTDPFTASLNDGAKYIRSMFTTAAEQMSEADYAYKPTPDVRSFAQLIAHVADSNYWFCSAAKGEKPPTSNIEKTKTTRDEIRKALEESFAYCDSAYTPDVLTSQRTTKFNGKERPPIAILNFRAYHGLLHYGNVITYMRLRGKVPPSSQLGG